MKLTTFFDNAEKACLERAEKLTDAAWKTRFSDYAQVIKKVRQIPMGAAHDEDCACGHDHGPRGMTEYLVSYVGDPVRAEVLGMCPFIPGEDAITVADYPDLRGLPGTDGMIVVADSERAKAVALSSRHPLKRKMPSTPMAFGHAYDLALRGPMFMDAETLKRFEEFASLSTHYIFYGLKVSSSSFSGKMVAKGVPDLFPVPVHMVGVVVPRAKVHNN